jgi:hypothetical protein
LFDDQTLKRSQKEVSTSGENTAESGNKDDATAACLRVLHELCILPDLMRRYGFEGNSAFDHCVDITFEDPLMPGSAIIRAPLCNKGSIVLLIKRLHTLLECPNFPATLDNIVE